MEDQSKQESIKRPHAEQKEAVLKQLAPMETLIQQATASLAKIEEAKEKVLRRKEDLTHEITASFDALHCVLEEQKQALLGDLQEQTDLKLATIEIQQQDVEEASSKLQQVIESVYTASMYNDDGHDSSKKPQLAAKVTEVTNTLSQVSLNPVVEPDLVARVLPPVELKRACVSTNYVRKGVPDLQRCSAKGDGLIGADMHSLSPCTVYVANEHGVPCSGKVSVELKTLRDGSITQPQLTACSLSHFKTFYTPTVRGRHELSIKVNGEHIPGSPFKVFVRIPVKEIKYPVAEITDLVGPGGLHSTAERILVCDYGGGKVVMYNHSLKVIATIGESHSSTKKLKGPKEVTTDSQSNIYVTTVKDNCLHKFAKDGTHVKTVTGTGRMGGQFSFPNGLCVSKDRLLYVCDSNNSRVLVFDLNLRYLSKVSGHFVCPSDLDIDTSGKVYVCDYKAGSIQIFSSCGQYLHTISNPLKRPMNIKVFGELFYVSDFGRNIFYFTLSGDYIGSLNFDDKYLSIYLESPEGLAIDEDGYFYVSNQRSGVYVF